VFRRLRHRSFLPLCRRRPPGTHRPAGLGDRCRPSYALQMGSAWSEFLEGAAGASPHGAQVYSHLDELAESVGAYLLAGLGRGEPAVVVARPEHWAAFAARLSAGGGDDERLQQTGLLQLADADDTLAAVIRDDALAPDAFTEVIGALLDRAEASAPGAQVRVFGEMVDVLCARGDMAGAVALEELWNALGRDRSFSLLCGYRLNVFERTSQVGALPHVCRLHSHVQPAADPERMTRAVDRALAEVLGPADAGKVYLLLGDQLRRKRVPLGQLALMWVSEHMPTSSERVLVAARAHYLAA
jgi:hypothetical protein